MQTASKLFLALFVLGIALFMIYINIGTTEAAASPVAGERDSNYECRLNCDGYCSIDRLVECNGQCIPEKQEVCSFHQ